MRELEMVLDTVLSRNRRQEVKGGGFVVVFYIFFRILLTRDFMLGGSKMGLELRKLMPVIGLCER